MSSSRLILILLPCIVALLDNYLFFACYVHICLHWTHLNSIALHVNVDRRLFVIIVFSYVRISICLKGRSMEKGMWCVYQYGISLFYCVIVHIHIGWNCTALYDVVFAELPGCVSSSMIHTWYYISSSFVFFSCGIKVNYCPRSLFENIC